MNSSKACGFFISVFALALVALASDFWRDKPYSEWNEKEVRQLLEDSPWAHRVRIMLVSSPSPSTPCSEQDPYCSADSAPSLPVAPTAHRRQLSPDDVQALQDRRAASSLPATPGGVAATAVVRWLSARTVREAMVRDRIQRGLLNPKEVKPSSAFAPMDNFVLYVDLRVPLADVPKVPQHGLFTAAMMRNSALVMKSIRERIAPLAVRAAPLPQFDDRKELALGAFYIFFPRMTNGKPSLPPGETRVRFECPTVPVPIQYEFDLRKMKRQGSPDL